MSVSRLRTFVEILRQDVAYALRSARGHPGVTAVAVATLGGAIGLHATLFTLFHTAFLRPWPVKDPGRVVEVLGVSRDGRPRATDFSLAEYNDLAQARSFAGLAAMTCGPEPGRLDHCRARLDGEDLAVQFVSGNYFRVAGTPMARGRDFAGDSAEPGAAQAVAVLSDHAWRTRFAGDPTIVGRLIRLDGVPFAVVGVAAPDFTGTSFLRIEAWLPLSAVPLLHPHDRRARPLAGLQVAGRLAEGVSRTQARGELEALAAGRERKPGAPPRRYVLLPTSFFADVHMRRRAYTAAGLTFGGLLLLLAAACANVGNLLLARAATRGREMALRAALGAGRPRLVRQLMTESLLLALAAGAVGVGIAYALPSYLADQVLPWGQEVHFLRPEPDARVLALTFGLAAATSLLFGLAPALQASRADISGALKGRSALSGLRMPLRSVLLAVQIALSIVLLTTAGLLARGLQSLRARDLGFGIDGLTVASFDLGVAVIGPADASALSRRLQEEAQALPAPAHVAFAVPAPFVDMRVTRFRLPGDDVGARRPGAEAHAVSPEYFAVMPIRIRAGRPLEASDADAVVVNETLAQRCWPGESPLGKTVIFEGGGDAAVERPRTVVGVAANTATNPLTLVRQSAIAAIYEPIAHARLERAPHLLVRGAPSSLPDALRHWPRRVDPRMQVRLTTLRAAQDKDLRLERLGPWIGGVLGAAAAALACLGVFGVFAYSVERRRPEIALRVALGAPPLRLIREVVGAFSRPIALGLAFGLLASLGAAPLIRGYLHGVSPFDARAYASVALVLAAVGALATYIPARRAVRTDPAVVLRSE